VSKAFGETLGTYYADRHDIEVVNLRIGWLDSETLRRTIVEDKDNARYARAMYLSERDCRDALVKSVEADIPRNPLTVNILSRNQERYLTLTEAMRGLGYEPRDDSSEVFD
jgi:L-arabinose 1-dehydrogenase [NAD(P)+]